METQDFIKLVAQMRKTQQDYFKESKRNPALAKSLLIRSKELERQVDSEIRLLVPDNKPKQGELLAE